MSFHKVDETTRHVMSVLLIDGADMTGLLRRLYSGGNNDQSLTWTKRMVKENTTVKHPELGRGFVKTPIRNTLHCTCHLLCLTVASSPRRVRFLSESQNSSDRPHFQSFEPTLRITQDASVYCLLRPLLADWLASWLLLPWQ